MGSTLNDDTDLGIISKEEIMKAVLEDPYKFLQGQEISLFEFFKLFWNEVSEDELKLNWHIEYLCGELQKVAERVGDKLPKEHDVIINIPPGTTKTILVSVMWPAWCWTRWFWMKFITGSYSDALALEAAEKCRDILMSDKFKALYPDIAIKEDKNTKSNFRIAKKVRGYKGNVKQLIFGGGRFSTSVGGTITGFHGHINIWDDPINPKQAASDVQIETVNRWVDQSASTRKADKNVTVTVVVMQRLHEDDPSGHLLAKEDKKILHICLPGEIRNYRQFLKPLELEEYYIDDLLDPVRLSWTALREMEADLGVYGFAGQVGQNPVPPGGGMFKADNFAIMHEMPNPAHIVSMARYWDKAATDGGGKYTAGVKIARLSNGKYLVVDVKRGQWGVDVREDIILNTAIADGRNVQVYIEKEPGSGGKESAENTIRNLAGFIIEADAPQGDKIYRAGPYAIQVNRGNVLLLYGSWNKQFIEEHRKFPRGSFKDQVDAASACFNKLALKRVVRALFSNRRN